MQFEIINPSDKAYIDGDDFKEVCIATIILGEGLYGLREVKEDSNLEMPPVRFATGWFIDKFGLTIEEAIKKVNNKRLKEIFQTVRLERERSSINDIVGRAKQLAESIKVEVSLNSSQP